MAKYVTQKKIIVKSAGTLHLLAGATGPILTPFMCKVDTILHLINTRKDVYEVLEDGTEIKLDEVNYNTLNEKVKKEKVEEPKVKKAVVEAGVDGEELHTETAPIKENPKNQNKKKNK